MTSDPSITPAFAARLAPHRLFHSYDLDETRAAVARIFKPHDLGVYGARQKLDARMDHLALGKVSLNRLCYGANVSIEPGCLDDFLLVQMPLDGQAEIQCGAQKIISSPHRASVLTPTLPLHMRWQGRCDQLIVRIDRRTLEAACAAQLGHALPRPIEFHLDMDMRQGAGRSWRELVAFLSTTPFIDGATQHPMVMAHVEQLLVTTLLASQPHNYTDALTREPALPEAPYVTRAADYIIAHCDQPLTMETLARHASISTRSLYKGFQQYRGTSPMAFLKLVRLQRVREQLLQARSAGKPVSITQVALDWGFSHLGHFTQSYRRQYGESPSETLSG